MKSLILCLTLVFSCCSLAAQTVQQPSVSSIGVGTSVSGPSFGGIAISASGVISEADVIRVNTKLEQQRLRQAAQKSLPADLSRTSKLRKVSLVRLEAELKRTLSAGENISEAMRHIAGLTRIEYVFADRDRGDLIIAGPAEAFAATRSGAVVGIESGRPTLLLDDLLVMLRLPNMKETLGCSFDPDRQRLASATAWYQDSADVASAAQAKKQFQHMAKLLGNYNVTVFGLPKTSHAAWRFVEADYQLKRINLGLVRTGIRGFRSQLAMMRPTDNSMRRYWFGPHYEKIERTADGAVFQLSGPRLQLLSEDEVVDASGNRAGSASKDDSTKDYTRQFNNHIEQLCVRTPAFAALQNLFDMAVFVALAREHQLFETAGWRPSLMLDEEQLPTARYPAPTAVPAQVNTRREGRSVILFQIGGGVKLIPADIATRYVTPSSADIPKLTSASESWWWD